MKEPTLKEVYDVMARLREKGYDPYLTGKKGRVKLGFYKTKRRVKK